MPTFVSRYFEECIGRMYYPDAADFIWFAFDRGSTDMNNLQSAFGNEASIEKVSLV